MKRREFLKTMGAFGVSAGLPKAKPIDTVRVGVIGLGARGSFHVELLLLLEGVELKALCDVHPPAAEESARKCAESGRPRPALYTEGERAYRALLEREDLDAVLIATPWRWHTPMAVDAMNAGKHALTEVPAAVTLDECLELVETQERTGRN